jgi:hypothetical protein
LDKPSASAPSSSGLCVLSCSRVILQLNLQIALGQLLPECGDLGRGARFLLVRHSMRAGSVCPTKERGSAYT